MCLYASSDRFLHYPARGGSFWALGGKHQADESESLAPASSSILSHASLRVQLKSTSSPRAASRIFYSHQSTHKQSAHTARIAKLAVKSSPAEAHGPAPFLLVVVVVAVGIVAFPVIPAKPPFPLVAAAEAEATLILVNALQCCVSIRYSRGRGGGRVAKRIHPDRVDELRDPSARTYTEKVKVYARGLPH